mgnify:FL=1
MYFFYYEIYSMNLLSDIYWWFLSKKKKEEKLKEIERKRIEMLPEYKKLMYSYYKEKYNNNN